MSGWANHIKSAKDTQQCHYTRARVWSQRGIPKSDSPDYSVAGEFSPGALVIGGEPFDVGLDESHPTTPPDHPGASPWDAVVRRGLKLMKKYSPRRAHVKAWPMR